MNNDEVIEILKTIIDELIQRITELNGLRNDPSVPFNKRPIRRNQILQRVTSINLRILHLEQILDDRELIQQLQNTVPPLSNSRKNKLNTALTKVSQNISATNTFKAAIKLSAQVSKAASSAAENTSI